MLLKWQNFVLSRRETAEEHFNTFPTFYETYNRYNSTDKQTDLDGVKKKKKCNKLVAQVCKPEN